MYAVALPYCVCADVLDLKRVKHDTYINICSNINTYLAVFFILLGCYVVRLCLSCFALACPRVFYYVVCFEFWSSVTTEYDQSNRML